MRQRVVRAMFRGSESFEMDGHVIIRRGTQTKVKVDTAAGFHRRALFDRQINQRIVVVDGHAMSGDFSQFGSCWIFELHDEGFLVFSPVVIMQRNGKRGRVLSGRKNDFRWQSRSQILQSSTAGNDCDWNGNVAVGRARAFERERDCSVVLPDRLLIDREVDALYFVVLNGQFERTRVPQHTHVRRTERNDDGFQVERFRQQVVDDRQIDCCGRLSGRECQRRVGSQREVVAVDRRSG